MADTDLIACVYPYCDKNIQYALEAIELNEDRPQYSPGLKKPESRNAGRGRGSTEEPEADDNSDIRPRLELRFSNGPKTSRGFVFGREDDCDIQLPDYRAVSSYHFALTFDDHNRLIVRDLDSCTGIQVKYEEDGEGWRKNFVWIVGGHVVPEKRVSIVIYVNKYLTFQLVMLQYDPNSQLYKDNIERLRQGTAEGEDLFNWLKFTQETECGTESHIPGSGLIWLKKKLGEGSFGVVTHFWNVSNAEEYALKQPSDRAIREKEVNTTQWIREADIMGWISHEHIVRLLDREYYPLLKLMLKYVPGGLLSLTYLHGLEPLILHRDIKLDNILVQYRYAGYIFVKFSDFRLSKDGGHWKTICGTWIYAAPEIFEIRAYYKKGGRKTKHYTPAVDIWSLGCVITRLTCGFPRYDNKHEHGGTLWGEEIVKRVGAKLRNSPNEVLQFVSTTMLIVQPGKRCLAQECYDGALRLPGASYTMLQTSTSAPWEEDGEETVRYDPQTAILRQTEGNPFDTAEIAKYIITPDNPNASTEPAEIQRQAARSNNPPASSRKRRPSRVSRPAAASGSRRGTKQSTRQNQHVKNASRGNEVEARLEMEHHDQNPGDPSRIGPTPSALEQHLPASWGQPLADGLYQRPASPEPDFVAGGLGYAAEVYPGSLHPGEGVAQPWLNPVRSWGAGGRSWDVIAQPDGVDVSPPGKSAEFGNGGPVVPYAYDEEQELAAMLLQDIQAGGYNGVIPDDTGY